jgi:hypothetical protein
MNVDIIKNSKGYIAQLGLFLTLNSLFIFKYIVRVGFNPYFPTLIYIVTILLFLFIYKSKIEKLPEKTLKLIYIGLVAISVLCIILLLIYINPFSIRVDRWSGLAFFWDSFFQGKYPYGAHTHICNTNYPSPFPFWQFINLPFYLLGDVGIGLIAFLILLSITLRYYFSSYRKSLLFLLLLLLSPAYWWEVSVRSDSLSNGFMVFMIIMWYEKQSRNLLNSFWLSVLVCGCIATTRLSAIIPIALYFLHSYIKIPTERKIIFPIAILGIVFVFFSPFIFWDTHTWIFFTRNPLISQTNGSIYIFNILYLLLMIAIGVIISLRWKNLSEFTFLASFFIFFFILTTTVIRLVYFGWGNLFTDAISDISYLTLSLPYCIAYLTLEFKPKKY